MSKNEETWDIYFSKKEDTPDTPSQTADIPISKKSVSVPQEEAYSNDYDSDFGEQYRNGFTRFWLKNKKRNLKLLLVSLMLVVVTATAAVVLFIDSKLDLIDYNNGLNFENADQTNLDNEDEQLAFTPMHDVTDASSLKDWLQKWAKNGGEKMHSSNVINCLLCGIDTQEGSVGRTDAMILVSLNKKTDKITLVSFMRDSYTYMDIDGRDRWYKINSAYNWGGAATLVETIENNYKIEIDNYVTVDFDTFPKLINALGGVTLEVQDYEAKYINRTTVHTIESGKNVTLDGWEALVFARIRYSDSDGDVSRTRRQRQLVTALIQKAKSASVGQLNNLLNTVLPYVQTNYRKSQIFSLGTQALMQGWVHYDMEQLLCPLLTDSEDGTQPLTGKDSYMMTGYGSRPEFVWIVDYQLEAQRIQTALYGMSNVEIHDYRESPFDFLSGSSGSTSAGSATTQAATTTAPAESTTRLIDRFWSTTAAPDIFGENTQPVETPPAAENGDAFNSFEGNDNEENNDSIFALP